MTIVDQRCAAPGLEGQATPVLARIGVILPSSNRMIEPQFMRRVPPGAAVHFARARMTGPHARKLADLGQEVAFAAQTLADAKTDLILFNCTATSMKEGPKGDAFLLDLIERSAGVAAVSTATAVTEALHALNLKRLVLITPYVQATNDHEKDYLRALDFDVVRDVALGLRGGDDYIKVPAREWVDIATAADGADCDGFFMSCTNTTQIDAIEEIERATAKPAVSANQAALWACVRRLASRLGEPAKAFDLPGRLRDAGRH